MKGIRKELRTRLDQLNTEYGNTVPEKEQVDIPNQVDILNRRREINTDSDLSWHVYNGCGAAKFGASPHECRYCDVTRTGANFHTPEPIKPWTRNTT